MKRLFVAVKIHPSPEVLRVYYSLKKDLALEKIKWVEEDKFHLTLKFIGNTHPSFLQKIDKALTAAASVSASFNMSLRDPGIFGSRYNPRVIWLGIENNPQLAQLVNSVLDGLDAADFPRDRQNFVPHLTIARIKHIHNKKHLKEVIDKHKGVLHQPEEVSVFYLFESGLTRQGPVYKILKEYTLMPG